jgi:hypothetical protein
MGLEMSLLVSNSSTLGPTASHVCRIHKIQTSFTKIHFNTIIPSTRIYIHKYLHVNYSDKTFVYADIVSIYDMINTFNVALVRISIRYS